MPDSFPKPTLTPIVGVPTYKTIKKLNYELSKNATLIHSDLSGGNLDHLAILVSPTIYATLSNAPFVSLVNPQQPNLQGLTGLNGPHILATNRRYDANKLKFPH